jgi:hypothetical protein
MNRDPRRTVSGENMRTKLVPVFFLAAVAAVVSPGVASADAADSLLGRYEVAFEQVTSNCQGSGLTLAKGSLAVTRKAPGVAVELSGVPAMGGKVAKVGRLKAASELGKATQAGLEGKFSIAGTVDGGGKLEAVFVAEFYADGKPKCTQSWSVAGTRTAAAAPPPAVKSATEPAATRSGRTTEPLATPAFFGFGALPAVD